MKRTLIILIPILSMLLLLAACGDDPSKPAKDSLGAKKAELKELKNQLVTISRQIQELEGEIASKEVGGTVKTVAVAAEFLKPKTFKHYVKVQGQVASNKNILVSPKTTGLVTAINVRQGDYVKAGKILAKLDDAVMMRNVEEVQTQLELATILYEKQKNLWDQEVGTEVQYLTAKNQKESLERRLETLNEQLDMSVIKAPISGVVDEVIPKLGEMVSMGMPSFRIVNLSDLRLETQLSETYIPFVRKGDEVNITFPALNKEFVAKVTVVGQSIDPKNRTFVVEVKLPSDPMIKPNMYGEISINDRSREDAIVVPQKVLQRSEKGNYVYIAVDNGEGQMIAQRQNIVIGLSYGGEVEVTEGLTTDDHLITTGFKSLSDGQAITLNEAVALTE